MRRFVALAVVLGCGSSSKPAPVPPQPVSHPARSEPGDSHAAPASAPSRTTSGKPASAPESSAASGNRCDALAVSELSIDGITEDWDDAHVVARVGAAPDGVAELQCAWDGSTLALLVDIKDDRVLRVKGGTEDRVTVAVSAGGKPVTVTVFPGNSMGTSKITKPAKVEAADSLQPKGFSVEVAIPAAVIPGYSPSTPAFDLALEFSDSDAATGGDTTPLKIAQPLELADRKDLLDDFLATVRLKRTDLELDTLVELDPDRKGQERLVAGGTVIGVLTDQFAYVSLPAASPTDVKKVELLPLGPKGQQIVSAVVRQTGGGGSRDLLMLWTVWSGQLQPLASIEIRKELAGNVLESTYKLAKGKKGPELVVEAKPAVGFTAETWNEAPAGDADSIVLPWDPAKSGIAYTLKGAEIERRDLPAKKPSKR